jgi:cell division initiation protein
MREASSNEELEKTTFSTALRGYDRDEVDAFVRMVAQEMRELHHGRTEKIYESLGEEMGGLLQHARDSAEAMTREAEEQAAATRAQAEADAQRTREESLTHARDLQQRAEQEASETRAEAEGDASRRIAEATERVRELEGVEGRARARINSLLEELDSIINNLRVIQSGPENEPAEKARQGASEQSSATHDQATPTEKGQEEHKTIRLEPQESSIR